MRAECPGEPFAEGGDSVSVGADVERGEDVSRDHSREECECPFVIVSVTLVAECVHDPSLHGPEGVEGEEREEECRRPEEGQAQDGDVPLAKTGPGQARRRRRRRRNVETNEFSDERPTTESRNDDDNNNNDNQHDNKFPKQRIEKMGGGGRREGLRRLSR